MKTIYLFKILSNFFFTFNLDTFDCLLTTPESLFIWKINVNYVFLCIMVFAKKNFVVPINDVIIFKQLCLHIARFLRSNKGWFTGSGVIVKRPVGIRLRHKKILENISYSFFLRKRVYTVFLKKIQRSIRRITSTTSLFTGFQKAVDLL